MAWKNLTKQQEEFCQGVASGMTQSAAYKASYQCKTLKQQHVYVKASSLMALPKIKERVAELKDLVTKQFLWERYQSIKHLSNLVESPRVKPTDRINAIKELNAMHGFIAPKTTNLTNSDGSLHGPLPDTIVLVDLEAEQEETGE